MTKLWFQLRSLFGGAHLVLILFLAAWLLLTIPALFSTSHIRMNLEPYPDGLTYALAGRNLAVGQGLQLEYQSVHKSIGVPPLYPLVLSAGYLINQAPGFFYATNVMLGALTIFWLWLILRETTETNWAMVAGLAVYISHGYLSWLPTVPMTENLSLLLVVIVIWGLVSRQNAQLKLALSVVAMVGLMMTRLSSLGLVAVFGIAWFMRIYIFAASKDRRRLVGVGIMTMFGVVALGLMKSEVIVKTLTSMWSQLTGTGVYYSFSFILPNVNGYISPHLGGSTQFLWLQYPLTSWAVSILWLGGVGIGIYEGDKETKWKYGVILATFLAQFPILLIFYVVDARYSLYSLPLFALGIGWWLNLKWGTKSKLITSGLFLLALVAQLVSQAGLIKEVVSNNLLHRSQAWQYEAVLSIDSVMLKESGSHLVTALPPYYVRGFSTGVYRILPLSGDQEYLKHGMFVWGDGIAYDNLAAGYVELLKAGEQLYISNAYITHQQSVVNDYEKYKEIFEFELVQEGCLQACNVYRLRLK